MSDSEDETRRESDRSVSPYLKRPIRSREQAESDMARRVAGANAARNRDHRSNTG